MSDNTKSCPYCAETIKLAAIVCKHCGRDLPEEGPSVPPDQQAEAAKHGIRWADDRWVYAGSYFKQLPDAIRFADGNPGQQEPAPTHEASRPTKWWVWPIGAIGLFMLWAMFRTPSPEQEAKSRERYAIELCWEDQKRKSLDAATAQFVAGACEEMERRFKAQYGVNP